MLLVLLACADSCVADFAGNCQRGVWSVVLLLLFFIGMSGQLCCLVSLACVISSSVAGFLLACLVSGVAWFHWHV